MAVTDLTWLDYTLIGIYLVITFSVGLWSATREKTTSSSGYFLAGRSMSWWTIGLSLFISNIGSNTFIMTAGAAAANGVGVMCYEFAGIYSLLLLAYFFVPIYLSSEVFTMPEYMIKRFGGTRLQVTLSVQSLLMYIFSKLSLEVYAGTLIIEYTMGINHILAIIILMLTTALYTIVGGLTTVIITGAMQGIIVICVAATLAIISLVKIGGEPQIQEQFLKSFHSNYTVNSTCGAPDPQAFHMMRAIDDPNYPWLGAFFGANILSAWHFCTDQLFVQRTLAAKNLNHAKAGGVFAGFLKILPLFLMIWPGMISRILYTDTVACMTEEECYAACKIKEGCTNIAYIEIMRNLLPQGLRGVMIAAMLAALISSITSIFNSGSTLFTMDLWCRFRKNASQTEQMVVGRVFILVLMTIGILWLPVISTAGGGQLVVYAQSVTSYLTPPILAAFLLAVTWPRGNEQGVFWGLIVGIVIGTVRMILSFIYTPPRCNEKDTRPSIVADVHFLHFAILLFVISMTTMIIISLFTKPTPKENLLGTTWLTRENVEENEEIEGNTTNVENDATVIENVPQKESEIVDKNRSELSMENEVAIQQIKQCRVWLFLLRWLCGISYKKVSEEELEDEKRQAVEAAAQRRLEEKVLAGTWQRYLVDLLAMSLLAVASFLWGYYS